MAVSTRRPLPTELYSVIAEVANVHIAGRKVLHGDEIALSAPVAEHWVNEGVIKLKSALEAEAAAKTSGKSSKTATTDGAAS